MAKVTVSPLRKKEKRKHAEAPFMPEGSWGGTRFHVEICYEGERFDVALSPREAVALHNSLKRAMRDWVSSMATVRKFHDELAARRALEPGVAA